MTATIPSHIIALWNDAISKIVELDEAQFASPMLSDDAGDAAVAAADAIVDMVALWMGVSEGAALDMLNGF